jgi:hypothetical protein
MDGTRRVLGPALLYLAVGLAALGCSQVAILPAPGPRLRPIADLLGGPLWSPSTGIVLNRFGMCELARHDPQAAFTLLEQQAVAGQPDPEYLLALADLADQIGRTAVFLESGEALRWSRAAAVYAVFCLAQPGDRQDRAVIWCAARAVHNRAVSRCLRLVRADVPADHSAWAARLAEAGIVPATTVLEWAALRFDTLQSAEEFTTTLPGGSARSAGLGVPLIASRQLVGDDVSIWRHYGPGKAVFPATAVIQSRGTLSHWRDQPVELVLHDPMRTDVVNVDGRPIFLARDLSVPLVHRLRQIPVRNYEYLGVFDPELYAERAGVYAVDPYQPGKVPVVFVHGIWSSPAAWVGMLDGLRRDPVLRASCQFWVVLYPSGYPLPMAAVSMRHSLREIRQHLDPQGADAALDQMVIVGKSTGGQTARLLVQPSGETLWKTVFARPFDQVDASATLRSELADMFFFEPEPYIRRVVFVTTGHRGSRLARPPWVRLGVELVRRNNPLRRAWAELRDANGPEIFQPFFQDRVPSSVDGLQAGNPLLVAIDSQPIDPGVPYHSIIASIHRRLPPERMTDGLVRHSSAHLDGAASETIISASHLCASDPQVIAEVRRILMVHLAEVRATQPSLVH